MLSDTWVVHDIFEIHYRNSPHPNRLDIQTPPYSKGIQEPQRLFRSKGLWLLRLATLNLRVTQWCCSEVFTCLLVSTFRDIVASAEDKLSLSIWTEEQWSPVCTVDPTQGHLHWQCCSNKTQDRLCLHPSNFENPSLDIYQPPTQAVNKQWEAVMDRLCPWFVCGSLNHQNLKMWLYLKTVSLKKQLGFMLSLKSICVRRN